MSVERTLVVFKPDSVQRQICGEIIARFEKVGLKVVGLKMVKPDKDHFHKHYEGVSGLISRWGQEIYDITLEHMTEAPVIAMVLEGVHAVSHVRKMVGTTDPKDSAPGTIRGDYTHVTRAYTNERGGTLPNIVHASGDPAEARKEIELWFEPSELYDYMTVHESVVRGRVPDSK